MVDKFKGVVEVEVDGKIRGFKFGIRCNQLFAESMGIKFSDVPQALGDASGNRGENPEDVKINTIMEFYHAAAIAYSRLKKEPDPTLDEVYSWIEEVTMDVFTRKVEQASEIPNSKAPEMAGLNLS